jgi:ribonuclease HI
MIYTDGSCTKSEEGTLCSSGVYIPGTHQAFKINPAGDGLTNNINRAELAAILIAIQEGLHNQSNIYILSDSLCSLLQIHKYLLQPHKMDIHIHRHLLQAIHDALDRRCSQQTSITFLKVKAHTGIPGNEIADTIASKPYPPLPPDTPPTLHSHCPL